MGAALLGGMIDSGTFTPNELGVVELLDQRRVELAEMFPDVWIGAEIPRCRSAVLAVKPADAAQAARDAAGAGATRLLSIAAGVRLATLQDAVGHRDAVGPGVAVIRAMPNTPALVRRGAAAIAGGEGAGDDDIEWAASILGAVGTVDRLPEPLLDAFTGIAGSGPAYLFLIAEALIEAAVDQGIDRAMAERVVRQLLLGSALLLDRELDPIRLRRQVTSPGGTTAAGIAVFEDRELRDIVARRCARRRNAAANSVERRHVRGRVDTNLNYLHVFSACHFSHWISSSMVRHVETRSPATASSADRAGAIGGLAPALVAFSGNRTGWRNTPVGLRSSVFVDRSGGIGSAVHGSPL